MLALVVAAPLLGIVALRAPLVNQLGLRDTWFYSGHGWALRHQLEIFGWYYYGVRFPVVLPIDWASTAFGATGGYVVLRVVVLAATGAAVHSCVRAAVGARAAAFAVVMLALSPFYMRMVLWDYTSFIGLPCSIAGPALWLLGSERDGRPWQLVAAGALITAAVLANAFSGVLVVAILAVELPALARSGATAARAFARRAALGMAGGALCFAAGWLLYCAYAGFFSPYELLRPTVEFLRVSDQFVVPLQVAPSEWLTGEPRIWAPPLIALALVAAMRRRILAQDLPARIAQFAVLYLGVIWAYRFVVTSAGIETWWAYDMAAATGCFAAPLIVAAVSTEASERRVILASLGATVAVTLGARSLLHPATTVYDAVREHPALLGLVLAAGLIAVIGLWLRRAVVASASLLFATVAFLALTPSGHLGNGEVGDFSPNAAEELAAYSAGHEMMRLLAREDTPAGRVLLWSTLEGPTAFGWANLPHLQGGIQNVEDPRPLPELTPEMLDLIRYPTTRGLLVTSERPGDGEAAAAALRAEGVPARLEREGMWGGDRVHFALLRLRSGSGGGDASAARLVASTYLTALARRDLPSACRVLTQDVRVALALEAGAATCEEALRPVAGARVESVATDSLRGTARVRISTSPAPLELQRIGSIWRISGGAKVGG